MMARQVVWDDVSEGSEIGPAVRHPSSQQLVKYAGASGDYYQIHYDKDFAQSTGLEDVILHGALKNAFLGTLVTDWMGPRGNLRRLSCQYRGMDIPGRPIIARGVVSSKYEDDGEYLVDCEIWLENEEGQRTTPGKATVVLPKS
jgi:acyl dehydratase